VELKLAGEAMDSRNKAQSEASRFFLVTKGFFLAGTMVRHPISCAGLPLEAGLFCLLGGTEGRVRRRCRMGFGVVSNYWSRGQNAFSGLTDTLVGRF
jgi:hypothetical protein